MNVEERLKENFDEIMDAVSDDLLISDGKGIVLKVSSGFEEVYGIDASYAIGKTVHDLEREGYFRPSVIAEVLKEKCKITMKQETKNLSTIIVTATPVFDDDENIKFVVSFSRDITEMINLRQKYSKLRNKMERCTDELNKLRRDNERTGDLVFRSPEMEKVMTAIRQVADLDVNILLLGESGVGKTMLAKEIHKTGNRRGRSFVDINCAAIPANLMEAELFGYERGSFTGADVKGKVGLIELADKGTLLLDEISEMPMSLQAKLLKAIQDKEITKVGGTHRIKVDFRLIAASNRNLEELSDSGQFRKDLYYRLNVVQIIIPALRERKDDIVPLINFFMDKCADKYGEIKTFSPHAIDKLIRYDWPGNIRELSNVIERVYITGRSDKIQAEELTDEVLGASFGKFEKIHREQRDLRRMMDEYEANIIRSAYDRLGTTASVAKYLNISQPTAHRKIAKYVGGRDKVITGERREKNV